MTYNFLCHPLLLPSILPNIRVFSNKSILCIRWPKYWSFSFIISPSNEYSGLIFFRINWFDLLAVQATLKSLLQHHSSKTSILWLSATFMVQFSHPCMTTEETIALTIWTFVGKVMSLLLICCLGLYILMISYIWNLTIGKTNLWWFKKQTSDSHIVGEVGGEMDWKEIQGHFLGGNTVYLDWGLVTQVNIFVETH